MLGRRERRRQPAAGARRDRRSGGRGRPAARRDHGWSACPRRTPPKPVADAVRAGCDHVGENRVQEAADKFPTVMTLLRGHGRGADVCTCRPPADQQGGQRGRACSSASTRWTACGLAQALSRRRERRGRAAGAGRGLRRRRSAAAWRAARRARRTSRQMLEVPGSARRGPDERRAAGRRRAGGVRAGARAETELWQRLSGVHFGVLSMGMSEDFVDAIREGSTEVRIGTALFGPRKPEV